MDGVNLTIRSSSGGTGYAAYTIDDYDKRAANGDLAAYEENRALPKLREAYGPDYAITERKITYNFRPAEDAPAPAAAGVS